MEGLLPDLLAGAGIRAPVPVQAGQMLVILVLVAARPLGFIAMMPLFGRFHLTVGFLRGAVLASMIMPILPGAIVQVGATPDLVTPAGLPALIVRSLLVPALALDLGPRSWWPSRVGTPGKHRALPTTPR